MERASRTTPSRYASRCRLSRVQRRLGTIGAVALGGAAGTPARIELDRVMPAGPAFPWGTLTVNIAGSLLLGFLATLIVERSRPTRYLGPLLATGFCGAFTTFSTYVVETDLRIRSGDLVAGLTYAAVSVLAGLAAVVGGVALARRLRRREAMA